MKVVRIGDPSPTLQDLPIFTGEVLGQPIVEEGDAALARVGAITFRNGARTRLHHHSYDQILVVLEGQGILATEQVEYPVEPGHVVVVPAQERHWHGAAPGATMTHLSINQVGETSIDEESVDPPA